MALSPLDVVTTILSLHSSLFSLREPGARVVRGCQEIIESTFEGIQYGFTTGHSYHMLWW
jgi:hypothetical protein